VNVEEKERCSLYSEKVLSVDSDVLSSSEIEVVHDETVGESGRFCSLLEPESRKRKREREQRRCELITSSTSFPPSLLLPSPSSPLQKQYQIVKRQLLTFLILLLLP